jgi:hypothetical protein
MCVLWRVLKFRIHTLKLLGVTIILTLFYVTWELRFCWDCTHRRMVICCRRFGTTYQSQLQRSSSPADYCMLFSVRGYKLIPVRTSIKPWISCVVWYFVFFFRVCCIAASYAFVLPFYLTFCRNLPLHMQCKRGDVSRRFLRNVDKFVPDYTASHSSILHGHIPAILCYPVMVQVLSRVWAYIYTNRELNTSDGRYAGKKRRHSNLLHVQVGINRTG